MKNADTFVPYLVLLAALISLALSAGDRPQLPGPQEPLPRTPPTPPLLETFQGDPQLSLFPRLGDFRPEDDDERLPFWKSYREHLLKISGVVKADAVSSNRIFSFRGIKGIDSVAHFAPLAVQPNTRYRVRLKLNAKLPEKASTGVGLLQFRQFLWLGEQYPESLHTQLYLSSQELLRVRETDDWQDFDLQFTSGPETKMIHLLLFREGPASDRNPVLVDNISVMEE